MATLTNRRPRRRLAPWDEIAEDWSWSDEHHRETVRRHRTVSRKRK